MIIGVHSPEFAHEHKDAYVRGRIAALGIRYPVVMDNRFRIWRAYNNVLAMLLATIGQPQAIASRATIPPGSYREGKTATRLF